MQGATRSGPELAEVLGRGPEWTGRRRISLWFVLAGSAAAAAAAVWLWTLPWQLWPAAGQATAFAGLLGLGVLEASPRQGVRRAVQWARRGLLAFGLAAGAAQVLIWPGWLLLAGFAVLILVAAGLLVAAYRYRPIRQLPLAAQWEAAAADPASRAAEAVLLSVAYLLDRAIRDEAALDRALKDLGLSWLVRWSLLAHLRSQQDEVPSVTRIARVWQQAARFVGIPHPEETLEGLVAEAVARHGASGSQEGKRVQEELAAALEAEAEGRQTWPGAEGLEQGAGSAQAERAEAADAAPRAWPEADGPRAIQARGALLALLREPLPWMRTRRHQVVAALAFLAGLLPAAGLLAPRLPAASAYLSGLGLLVAAALARPLLSRRWIQALRAAGWLLAAVLPAAAGVWVFTGGPKDATLRDSVFLLFLLPVLVLAPLGAAYLVDRWRPIEELPTEASWGEVAHEPASRAPEALSLSLVFLLGHLASERAALASWLRRLGVCRVGREVLAAAASEPMERPEPAECARVFLDAGRVLGLPDPEAGLAAVLREETGAPRQQADRLLQEAARALADRAS